MTDHHTRTRWNLLAVLALVVLTASLFACSGDDDDDGSSLSVSFAADGEPAEGEIALVAGGSDDDRLVIDVVAGGGFTDAYGVAFRLTYDPGILSYRAVKAGGSLLSGGIEVIALGGGNGSGEVSIGVTRSDVFSGVVLDEGAVLAEIEFEAKKKGTAEIDFAESRRALVDGRLETIDVARWIGGAAKVY